MDESELTQPEDWEGVTMENGRVVELVLQDRDVNSWTLDAVPPKIGQLTSLKVLNLNNNKLTSLPAEIGQLTSLKDLNLKSS